MENVLLAALTCSKEWVIIPFFIGGSIFINRDIFLRSMMALLLSIMINGLFKTLFAIPLLPHLGEGYAFPSGHMQTAVVFWGYLLTKTSLPILRLLGVLVLCAIGYALVYFNYHKWIDIAGAVAVGSALVFIINKIETYPFGKNLPLLASMYALIALAAAPFISPFKVHHWGTMGFLFSFTFCLLLTKVPTNSSFISQCFEVVLITAGVVLGYYLYDYLDIKNPANLSKTLVFSQCFLIGTWILIGPKLVKRYI